MRLPSTLKRIFPELSSSTSPSTLPIPTRRSRPAEHFRDEGPETTHYRGHIPGARSVPYDQNLSRKPPVFLDPGALRELYEKVGLRFDQPVVAACELGIPASLNAFVLTWLGHTQVSVYDGS